MFADDNRIRFWAAVISLTAAVVTLLGALLHLAR